MASVLAKIRYYVTLPLIIFTFLTTPAAQSTESAKLVDTNMFVFDQALLMGQGITTDGEYYYTSGSLAAVNIQALGKFTVDGMETVATNLNPLPSVCIRRGNNHIGGLSYYNGKIYAPVEGGDEVYACIVVYDAETLEATGEVYDLPNELYPDGVPWCAVDENGYLYASVWDDAEYIRVYDVNDGMKHVRDIELSDIIDRIQGGEFYNGKLYLSYDIKNNGNYKKIMSVDVETGEVALAAERNVGSENVEAEGMTFTEGENGPILHVLDYNKAIGVFVHHYEVAF